MKKIKSIQVVKPGSNPDIDSDFNTHCRDKVIDYVAEKYGQDNVSGIVTFQKMAAKASFKSMCTIYDIPFSQANKITKLIPDPIEGVECHMSDLVDPESSWYEDGADFRSATSDPKWKPIIDGACAIEGRYKASGVHPCGVLISSHPLDESVPVMHHNGMGRLVSQWTYPECESLGLIKFDFLGLDTIDIVQRTVQFIMDEGRTPPHMPRIIAGDMDDEDTYKLISSGQTVGVFQLGSDLVMNYLKDMKPTRFADIVATTALMRPGPMGMDSHTHYARRKNGLEKVESIHPDFSGSPLDDILGPTYGLCVFQEQVMQIANRIAGMTLAEGDQLRKAMGKKKLDVMNKMKPKFFDGAQKNGYSKSAVEVLWDTIEPFSKYAFNKAHSVAYAMTAYEAAFLKSHYPVEFMSSLITQSIDDKNKMKMYLKEARRMGITVEVPDINKAQSHTSPHGDVIVLGMSTVKNVSPQTAQFIAEERCHGDFVGVEDVAQRTPLNKQAFTSLAHAGAFDSFGLTRSAVVSSLDAVLSPAARDDSFSLFDDAPVSVVDTNVPEYPHLEKMQLELEATGTYLTGHPMSRCKDTTSMNSRGTYRVMRVVSGVRKKGRRKSLSISTSGAQGEEEMMFLSDDVVKAMERWKARNRVKAIYVNGGATIPDDVRELACSEGPVVPEIVPGNIYDLTVKFYPGRDDRKDHYTVESIVPVPLADDGTLPLRFRVRRGRSKNISQTVSNFMKKLAKRFPGDCHVYYAEVDPIARDDAEYCRALIDGMGQGEADIDVSSSGDIFGRTPQKTAKKKNRRELPDPHNMKLTQETRNEAFLAAYSDYVDTGFTVRKCVEVEEALSNIFGAERVDFGRFKDESYG